MLVDIHNVDPTAVILGKGMKILQGLSVAIHSRLKYQEERVQTKAAGHVCQKSRLFIYATEGLEFPLNTF